MEDPKIKANLAAVEAHFHNEGLNEIEKACEGYTDDIVWERQLETSVSRTSRT